MFPTYFRYSMASLRMPVSFPHTTPAVRLPCPPRYLVALWTTMSAPCSSGRQRREVAKVLSTITPIPRSFAISMILPPSETIKSGFVTGSKYRRGRLHAVEQVIEPVEIVPFLALRRIEPHDINAPPFYEDVLEYSRSFHRTAR